MGILAYYGRAFAIAGVLLFGGSVIFNLLAGGGAYLRAMAWISAAFIIGGIGARLIAFFGEAKLARLQKEGIAYEAEDVHIEPFFTSDDQYEFESFQYFRIECHFTDNHGTIHEIRTGIMILTKGLRAATFGSPRYPDFSCSAIIYANPKNPADNATELHFHPYSE